MSRFISNVGLVAIASLALLSGCSDDGAPAEALADGGWGGPARLANCSEAEMCHLDRWASQGDFEVIVPNENAEVSSSDANVLEVVSAEPTIETGTPIFCFWDCSPTTFEYLSVIVRTKGPGDAELVIDGPTGDQRQLPIHVVDVERFQLVDATTGDILEAIDQNPSYVMLEAYEAGSNRLAVQGRWSVADPDAVSLAYGIFDDPNEMLEYTATALIIGQESATTTLKIASGEARLEFPIEL
jgi:hypothetical protein